MFHNIFTTFSTQKQQQAGNYRQPAAYYSLCNSSLINQGFPFCVFSTISMFLKESSKIFCCHFNHPPLNKPPFIHTSICFKKLYSSLDILEFSNY